MIDTQEQAQTEARTEVEKVAAVLRNTGETDELAIYKTVAGHFAELYARKLTETL